MNEALWSLLGVFVGFLLAEGTQWVKSKISNRELRKGLIAELQSIIRMIPSRIDILQQAECHLKNSNLMPTASTHFPNNIYRNIINNNPDVITPNERDCLHILYERLRIIDASMDNLESRLTTITSTYSEAQGIEASLAAVRDLKEALTSSTPLAQSVIDKNPIDVYPIIST
jgi:hypothetical protein